MKKVLIVIALILTVLIALTSCSYEPCATYSTSSMKQYGPKYTYAHAKVTTKKAKKNKVW